MKRMTKLWIATGILWASAPAMIAQETPKPNPVPPSSDALGAQLIVWSEMQKPQPISQPVREQATSERSDRQPDHAVAPPAQQTQVKDKDADRHGAQQK
ncbi:MAG: hypothetical protein WB919_18505 [Candidatus Sulfotelmatobacter sp.]